MGKGHVRKKEHGRKERGGEFSCQQLLGARKLNEKTGTPESTTEKKSAKKYFISIPDPRQKKEKGGELRRGIIKSHTKEKKGREKQRNRLQSIGFLLKLKSATLLGLKKKGTWITTLEKEGRLKSLEASAGTLWR